MSPRIRTSSSGIALIMVLIIIVVLGILAGGFAYSMKVETKLARNASFDSELEWMGRAGIEMARYILGQSATGPGGQYDSRDRDGSWRPDTNSVASLIPMDNYPLGNGTISLKIIDLDRKFNINTADEVILRQALTLIGVDAAASPTIVDSILDWRDPDDKTHLSGTESDEYASSPNPGFPPYFAKDGSIDDLTELLMVRGVTPNMYWGAKGGGRTPLARRATAGSSGNAPEEPTYAVGLVDLFTPLSSRLININTADASTLQVVPWIDDNIAQAIISGPSGRAGPDGEEGSEDDTPFRSVQELARVPGMNPAAVQQMARYCAVRSLIFEARVEARIGSLHRTYIGVIRRNNPRDIQVLNMYWQ